MQILTDTALSLQQKLRKVLELVASAKHVCEDQERTQMDTETRWFLSDTTLGLAKVLLLDHLSSTMATDASKVREH